MKRLFHLLSLDKAIGYTLAGRGWGLLSGLLTLSLVVMCLTPEEQGYYYTFASLLAMQILLELGMSQVIMQFASHEMAYLQWSGEDNLVVGAPAAKERLRSLFLLTTSWYGAVSVLMVVLVLPIGWWFFGSQSNTATVKWEFAWSCLVISAALNIFAMPLLALLEGCGKVTDVARFRMYQNIVATLAAWGVMLAGGGLLAMPAMSTGLFLAAFAWLALSKRRFLIDLFNYRSELADSISWKREVWPMQWKIGLSWMSGYFIFQLFTPVIFKYHGAQSAGQMGLSFSIANALTSIAVAWIGTRSPRFGTLIAQGDYSSLDNIFNRTLKQSLIVISMIGVGLGAANYAIHAWGFSFANRFLNPLPFALLIAATTFNYVTYAQATYLRAHKQEPFLAVSTVMAIATTILTFSLVEQYGSSGVMAGYLLSSLVFGLGWGTRIFMKKRNEWRSNSADPVGK